MLLLWVLLIAAAAKPRPSLQQQQQQQQQHLGVRQERGAPFRRGRGGGAPAGFVATCAATQRLRQRRTASKRFPQMKEAPQLPCACAWLEGGGEDGFGELGWGWGWEGKVFKLKSTFFLPVLRNKKDRNVDRKQKRVPEQQQPSTTFKLYYHTSLFQI